MAQEPQSENVPPVVLCFADIFYYRQQYQGRYYGVFCHVFCISESILPQRFLPLLRNTRSGVKALKSFVTYAKRNSAMVANLDTLIVSEIASICSVI